MSPKTTPSARSVSAAGELRCRGDSWSAIEEGSAQRRALLRLLRRRRRLLGGGLPVLAAGGGKIQVDHVAERVGVVLAHLLHERQRLLEAFHDRRVVELARALDDLDGRLLDAERLAVELRRGHGLEG